MPLVPGWTSNSDVARPAKGRATSERPMIATISIEDARLCAGVVKEIAAARGLARDPVAIGKLTTTVARLFNRGLRERDRLMEAAMEAEQIA